ncbi:MAG TPA: hypothetical protein VF317_13955 [Dermatophilaceae bacterium]
MSKPHLPMASASSPDDDPTGVRALLSGLPEPDPMPDYLVARITASLSAAQHQRAARTSDGPVSPFVASTRRRPGRLLFAMAGAAAAVALVAVLGTNVLRTTQPAGSNSLTAAASPSHARVSDRAATPGTLDKAAAGAGSIPQLIQIRSSQTRYTQADFATQARSLGNAVFGPSQPKAAESSATERVDTPDGLVECLRAVGVVGARTVRADLAYYEGAPAVIIVATTDNIPMAYVVGRGCSLTDPALLRPATPLP